MIFRVIYSGARLCGNGGYARYCPATGIAYCGCLRKESEIQRIIAVESFTVRLIPGRLMFHVGIDNEVVSFTVSLKCV